MVSHRFVIFRDRVRTLSHLTGRGRAIVSDEITCRQPESNWIFHELLSIVIGVSLAGIGEVNVYRQQECVDIGAIIDSTFHAETSAE